MEGHIGWVYNIYVEDITLLDKLGSTRDKQMQPDSNRCLFSPPSFQLWISPPASCARVLVPLLAWAPKIASHRSCATLRTAMRSYQKAFQLYIQYSILATKTTRWMHVHFCVIRYLGPVSSWVPYWPLLDKGCYSSIHSSSQKASRRAPKC